MVIGSGTEPGAPVTERPVALPPVDQREVAMPISPYLDGERFDPETKRVLGVAFELIRISLRTGDCDDDVYRAIARKLIELNKAGEHNPEVLCDQALKAFSQPPPDET
jgi:hypothetical protein